MLVFRSLVVCKERRADAHSERFVCGLSDGLSIANTKRAPLARHRQRLLYGLGRAIVFGEMAQ